MQLASWRPATRRHRRADFAQTQFDNMIGSNGVSDADNSLPPSGQTLRSLVGSIYFKAELPKHFTGT